MIKLIAVICNLTTHECVEKVVTTDVAMTACETAITALPEWMKQYPNFKLTGWKCQMGERRDI